mmetsp:Transcript_49565/g.160174  ORF Transcript_49565/g.160174 Transcript_49565/m.160174 type:complete len:254 (+) Transcript_49565:6003-6764(+)
MGTPTGTENLTKPPTSVTPVNRICPPASSITSVSFFLKTWVVTASTCTPGTGKAAGVLTQIFSGIRGMTVTSRRSTASGAGQALAWILEATQMAVKAPPEAWPAVPQAGNSTAPKGARGSGQHRKTSKAPSRSAGTADFGNGATPPSGSITAMSTSHGSGTRRATWTSAGKFRSTAAFSCKYLMLNAVSSWLKTLCLEHSLQVSTMSHATTPGLAADSCRRRHDNGAESSGSTPASLAAAAPESVEALELFMK